jgi:hypothetical protein
MDRSLEIYRRRAERLEAIAKETAGPAMAMLVSLAEQYRKLAELYARDAEKETAGVIFPDREFVTIEQQSTLCQAASGRLSRIPRQQHGRA